MTANTIDRLFADSKANPKNPADYGDKELHAPRVGDHAAALAGSTHRREVIANRIASWFDRGNRGGVRIIDIAAQMKIPLEVLHDERTQSLLNLRGIAIVRYPWARYVFAYRAIDGPPDGAALEARWSPKPDDGEDRALQGTGGYQRFGETCRRIVEFLEKNPGVEFGHGAIDAAVGVAPSTLKREQTEKKLIELGVTVRYTGTPGKNGSRRYYSVAK